MALVSPGLAHDAEIDAVVVALVAGERTPLQQPARVLQALSQLGPGSALSRTK